MLITVATLVVLALLLLVFPIQKVLGALCIALLIYAAPLPSLLTLAVILPTYLYLKRKFS